MVKALSVHIPPGQATGMEAATTMGRCTVAAAGVTRPPAVHPRGTLEAGRRAILFGHAPARQGGPPHERLIVLAVLEIWPESGGGRVSDYTWGQKG